MLRDNKGKIKGKNHSNLMFWFWETNCCKCEFTNELRTYREDIQIVYNHLAVKNPLYFLSYRSYIQSAVGRVSKRLFCSFADVDDIVFAISITDLIFRLENTVNAYAGSCAYYPIFRHGNEYR